LPDAYIEGIDQMYPIIYQAMLQSGDCMHEFFKPHRGKKASLSVLVGT